MSNDPGDRSKFLAMVMFLTLIVSGCSSKGPTEGGQDDNPRENPTGQTGFLGTYSLRSANGIAVPGVYLQAQNYRLEVTGGEVVFNSNFTYSFAIRFKLIRNGVTSTPEWKETGTFTVSGSDGLYFLNMTGGVATSGQNNIVGREIGFILDVPIEVLQGPGGDAVYLGDTRFIR